ncbi:MAG TPA: GNAT family N-acetyltransferase [Flavobacterium sp.]|nr:GNAT family N-acetyltransferase [Flavobacterium sp.]
MKTSFETDRLYFREFLPSDDVYLYELDSNPEVHLFLGNKPVKSIEESRKEIANFKQQYLENGIGRWAAFLKDCEQFIGWAGLKIEKKVNGHDRFYDLGYRLMPKHWGNGYATEAAKAFVKHGFEEMGLTVINAYASAHHYSSRAVLEKAGLQYVNSFEYEGGEEVWYEIPVTAGQIALRQRCSMYNYHYITTTLLQLSCLFGNFIWRC